jgi:hypothetical protein
LDFDVILFLQHTGDHWFIYVMFPKHKHLEAMDSMGYNRSYLPDFTNLWRWLNDDVRTHWGQVAPFDCSQWLFVIGVVISWRHRDNGMGGIVDCMRPIMVFV